MINYNICPMYKELSPEWQKTMEEEGCIYPHYGKAPHGNIPMEIEIKGKMIKGRGVKTLDKKDWPDTFEEDPECPGLGIHKCPYEEVCKTEA